MYPATSKRIFFILGLVAGCFVLLALCAPANKNAGEENTNKVLDEFPRIDPLPKAWVQELFEHVTSDDVARKKVQGLRAWKVAPWDDDLKKHVLLCFDIRLVAEDGIVYTYTYGPHCGIDSPLSVRAEYPDTGIFMLMRAYHKNNKKFVRPTSAMGNTTLSLLPGKGDRNERYEWQGRLNAALLALARAVDMPPPSKGTWQ